MKKITLNGQLCQTNHDTILELLQTHTLTQGRFAVEINEVLVPKSQLANTQITDGMRIEVVQAVGGG